MSPIDLTLVEPRGRALGTHRDELVSSLTDLLATDCPSGQAARRASWLADAVAQLVVLLPEPSRLGRQARTLVGSWPCPASAPSFHVDGPRLDGCGRRDVDGTWTRRTAQAWRQAWLLLSEELAESSLSPFAYVAPAAEDT